MVTSSRIYFDNAATSWPKPPGVYEAVDRYLREVGAPAGRGGYRTAEEADRIVGGCRKLAAAEFGLASPHRVIFAFNGTDALNMAIQGCLSPGSHVVTTAAEHNSVLRPLRWLEEQGSVSVSRATCDEQGIIKIDDLRGLLRKDTKLVVVSHASNVTGAIQPVEQIAELLDDHEALLLVDAAQTAGHLSCDLNALGADILATSGHKGLLGPLGTGILAIGEGVEERLKGYRFGGTGTESEEDRQPDSLPEKYESGNLNIPGIAGLRAGLEYLSERGVETLRQHTIALSEQMLDALTVIPGVTILGPSSPKSRMGVVSLTVSGYDPQEVAAVLDSAYQIEVRSGLHCAPEMHRSLGTFPSGTVRFSFGAFNTPEDVAAAVDAVAEISRATMKT